MRAGDPVDHPRRAMPARSGLQTASPLDGYLVGFLDCLAALPDGFSPAGDAAAVAQRVDVLPEFVDALFVSARTRGLIEPFRSKNSRGRYRWQVSNRGRAWLAGRTAGSPGTDPPS
jgi:hypothetical protein